MVCSSRDIILPTPYELQNVKHPRAVLQTLHEHFDLVLVHSDPRLAQIEEIIPWAEEITVPIEYTGYVSQRPSGRSPGRDEIQWHSVDDRRMTIVSAGGDGRTGLTVCAYSAWNRILSQSAVADRTLAVFLPLFPGPEELALLERPVGRHSIRLLSFTPHFMDWMQAADLSISQAGYNTCTNLLETRTRAILVPNPQMPDQLRRARLDCRARPGGDHRCR